MPRRLARSRIYLVVIALGMLCGIKAAKADRVRSSTNTDYTTKTLLIEAEASQQIWRQCKRAMPHAVELGLGGRSSQPVGKRVLVVVSKILNMDSEQPGESPGSLRLRLLVTVAAESRHRFEAMISSNRPPKISSLQYFDAASSPYGRPK